MTTNAMSALPGCPKCGSKPSIYWSEDGVDQYWCERCGFEGGDNWTRAVTRELAEQALALRAHGFQTMWNSPGEPNVQHDIATARAQVMSDYAFVTLQARALAAEALLRECVEYMQHTVTCGYDLPKLMRCDCGLDDLLARVREQLK